MFLVTFCVHILFMYHSKKFHFALMLSSFLFPILKLSKENISLFTFE